MCTIAPTQRLEVFPDELPGILGDTCIGTARRRTLDPNSLDDVQDGGPPVGRRDSVAAAIVGL